MILEAAATAAISAAAAFAAAGFFTAGKDDVVLSNVLTQTCFFKTI